MYEWGTSMLFTAAEAGGYLIDVIAYPFITDLEAFRKTLADLLEEMKKQATGATTRTEVAQNSLVEQVMLRPLNAFRGFKPAPGQEPEINVQLNVVAFAFAETEGK